MDMKKEYAKPSISITEIDYAGMLCLSSTPYLEEPNTDEVDVSGGVWDGKVL